MTDPDPLSGLPDPALWSAPLADDLGLYDPALDDLPAEEKIGLARRCEAAAFAADPRVTNSDGSTFGNSSHTRVLVNSLGFAASYRSSSCSLTVEAIADDADGKKRNAHWYSAARAYRGLDAPEEIGRIAAERAVRKLGARKLATQRVPVVCDPQVARAFVSHLARAVMGDALYRRATFLLDREGELVASPLLNLIDDATLPGRLRSRPFDGEGATARRNPIITGGEFQGFLFDSYSARKTGRQSTASASRGVGGVPTPSTTNLFIAAGPHSPAAIIASVERGVYLTDLMGFGWNLTTGDFSQGAAGLWIEQGELSYPVSEINVAGNLNEVLRDVDMVGDDLEFRAGPRRPPFGSLGSWSAASEPPSA